MNSKTLFCRVFRKADFESLVWRARMHENQRSLTFLDDYMPSAKRTKDRQTFFGMVKQQNKRFALIKQTYQPKPIDKKKEPIIHIVTTSLLAP